VSPPGQPLPRPTPQTPYRVLARSRQVANDWETLVSLRREVCIRCWDHLANTPTIPVGTRYTRLKGDLAWCVYGGHRLPQWQWEIDRRARVKVAIGEDFVVVMSATTGHPKENE
jgi:hypothetical protein